MIDLPGHRGTTPPRPDRTDPSPSARSGPAPWTPRPRRAPPRSRPLGFQKAWDFGRVGLERRRTFATLLWAVGWCQQLLRSYWVTERNRWMWGWHPWHLLHHNPVRLTSTRGIDSCWEKPGSSRFDPHPYGCVYLLIVNRETDTRQRPLEGLRNRPVYPARASGYPHKNI